MKIISICGARPNFMKIAPLAEEIKKHKEIKHIIIHTGQHYDEKLSKIFFDELGIPKPDINLEVGSGEREYQIREIKKRFRPILEKENPDLVIVVGDINSTIACAESAKEAKIKVAHVEAGLRSKDLDMPEEQNRIATDKISDYLFVTEKSGLENLEKEEISNEKVFFAGNVMIDTLIKNLEKSKSSKILEKFDLRKKEYAVTTIHRPSNVDKKEDIQEILNILKDVQSHIKLVLPLHPRTRNSLEKFNLKKEINDMPNLILTDPMGYLDFLNLISQSKFVLTDSGGIQEETTYLGIPCLTMRENTERPITITEGSNALVGRDKSLILSNVKDILEGRFKEFRIPKLWDGKTAERIIDIILKNEKNIDD